LSKGLAGKGMEKIGIELQTHIFIFIILIYFTLLIIAHVYMILCQLEDFRRELAIGREDFTKLLEKFWKRSFLYNNSIYKSILVHSTTLMLVAFIALIIIGSVRFINYLSISKINDDNLRYLLSSLVQSLSAIFGLIVTSTFIVLQISGEKSPTSIKYFPTKLFKFIVVCLILAVIFDSIMLFILPGNNILLSNFCLIKLLFIVLFAHIVIVFLLIKYIYDVLNNFKTEVIISNIMNGSVMTGSRDFNKIEDYKKKIYSFEELIIGSMNKKHHSDILNCLIKFSYFLELLLSLKNEIKNDENENNYEFKQLIYLIIEFFNLTANSMIDNNCIKYFMRYYCLCFCTLIHSLDKIEEYEFENIKDLINYDFMKIVDNHIYVEFIYYTIVQIKFLGIHTKMIIEELFKYMIKKLQIKDEIKNNENIIINEEENTINYNEQNIVIVLLIIDKLAKFNTNYSNNMLGHKEYCQYCLRLLGYIPKEFYSIKIRNFGNRIKEFRESLIKLS